MILPEALCNQSPGFCALIIREETPSPLPVSCPTDGFPDLTRQHCVVLSPGFRLIPLLPDGGGPALPGSPFRLGIPHQTCVENPLPEIHPPCYSGPDFPGPTDNQRLPEDDVGKDKESLGFPTPVDYPFFIPRPEWP